MNQLTEKSCEHFAAALASRDPVPGGGGAAALVGALGIALGSMVGNYTLGNKKYASVQDSIKAALSRGEELRLNLLKLVDEDAAAFVPLSQAYSIPKDNPNRNRILGEAAILACQAPLETVRCCAQAILLFQELLEKGNSMLVSDVGCGALLSRAALESAALNVYINTQTLKKLSLGDQAQKLEEEIDTLLMQFIPMAEEISKESLRRIGKSFSQYG